MRSLLDRTFHPVFVYKAKVIWTLAFEGCEKRPIIFFIPRNLLLARSISFNLGFRHQQFKPEALHRLYA